MTVTCLDERESPRAPRAANKHRYRARVFALVFRSRLVRVEQRQLPRDQRRVTQREDGDEQVDARSTPSSQLCDWLGFGQGVAQKLLVCHTRGVACHTPHGTRTTRRRNAGSYGTHGSRDTAAESSRCTVGARTCGGTHGSIFLKCSPSGPKHQNFSESSSPKERQKASGGGPCAPRDLTPPGRPGESPQAQGAVHEGKREERRDPESDTPTTRRPLTTPATTMHHHERSPARAASQPAPPIGTRFRSPSDGRKPGGAG